MKKKMYLIFEALMLIFLVGLCISFFNNFLVGTVLFKSAASLFFVLAGICGYVQNKSHLIFSRLMLIGFFCCMAGDVFLAVDSQGIIFVLGVASFAAAHVLFSAAFCRMCMATRADIVITLPVFAGLVLLLYFGNFNFQGLLPVLIGYAAVISFMAIKALSLWRLRKEEDGVILVMCGGVLFLLSDIVLLFFLFGIGTAKEIQMINWGIYYLAQGCLTAALNVIADSHS